MKEKKHQDCQNAKKKRSTEKKGFRRLASQIDTDFGTIDLGKRSFRDEEGCWIDLEYAGVLLSLAARTLYNRRTEYGLKCKRNNSKKYVLFEEVATLIMQKRVWQAPAEASHTDPTHNPTQEDVPQVEPQNHCSHGNNKN